MLKKLSVHIVDWQVRRNYLPDHKRELYEYAYEIMLNQVINILTAVLIAIVLRAPVPVILFLASYIPMRSYCGGYHAGTNGGCTVISAVLICIVCLGTKLFSGITAAAVSAVSFLVTGLLVFRYAPVEDRNKPLDDAEKSRYRRRGRIVWLLEVLIGTVLFQWNSQAGAAVGLSHALFSTMLCLGIIKNNKR